ncbi:MAG: ATP-binding protein, partial [Bradymonadaceae bacterium]
MQTEINIRTILDDVVHQFSDPLAFFRELVQNSIDAGTGEIEIELEHQSEASPPMAVISVRDWGEGMNREIIETKLVRLFSSGKDDDLTKIGRFGIGFVSVFAVDPDAVVVDTGRDGQYWRVLFSKDRSYELFDLGKPIEGTHVRIFKPMEAEAFEALKKNAGRTIVTWCKHAAVPVLFEGKDIRQDFDLPSRCKTTHEEEGTRIVMGCIASDNEEFAGYYNRGLTLNETHHSPWPWVSFKIDSRYLEHTLTRDQIIEDGHFEKASALLRRIAFNVLPEQLLEKLDALVHRERPGEEYSLHCRYLVRYHQSGLRFARPWRRRKLFRRADGHPMSMVEVRRGMRGGKLYLTEANGAIARAIEDEHLVLVNGEGEGCAMLLEALLEVRAPILEEEYVLLEMMPADDSLPAVTLHRAFESLLEAAGLSDFQIRFTGFDFMPSSRKGDEIYGAVVPNGEGLIRFDAFKAPYLKSVRDGQILLVNTLSLNIGRLMRLASREPEWAAFALAKLLGSQSAPWPSTPWPDGEDLLLRHAAI